MNALFIDTSALARRYLFQPAHREVRRLIEAPEQAIGISDVTYVEMLHVICRTNRERKIMNAIEGRLRRLLQAHVADQYFAIKINDYLLDLTRGLVCRYPLRTLDAIQLASASFFQQAADKTATFVSADKRLIEVAQFEGFAVSNPLDAL